MRNWNSLRRAHGRCRQRAVPALVVVLALTVPTATVGISRTVDAFDPGDATVAGDSPVALVEPRECDDCGLAERSSARRAERRASSPAPARPAPAPARPARARP